MFGLVVERLCSLQGDLDQNTLTLLKAVYQWIWQFMIQVTYHKPTIFLVNLLLSVVCKTPSYWVSPRIPVLDSLIVYRPEGHRGDL